MFGRKRREVELTNEAYARWLRAQRPPFEWFLGRSEVEQEALAMQGDEYTRGLALDIGYAVVNPEVAEAGVDAPQNPQSEETLLKQVMAGAVEHVLSKSRNGASGAREPDSSLTLAGVAERREKAKKARQEEIDASRSFLGRKPDQKDEPIRGC